MAKHIFISDLHLSQGSPVIQVFTDFMDKISQQTQSLYILGDFFDAWLGDDLSEPWVEPIIEQLKKLSDSGIKIFFMPGNRDFLVSETLAQRAGFKLIPDPYLINIGPEKFYLTHGDRFCTQDRLHLIYRKIIHHPITKFLAYKLPKKLRLKISQQLKVSSRKHKKKLGKIAFNLDLSILNFPDFPRNYHIIQGHIHDPHCVKLSPTTQRIVLGDWSARGAEYLIIEDGEREFRLSKFSHHKDIS